MFAIHVHTKIYNRNRNKTSRQRRDVALRYNTEKAELALLRSDDGYVTGCAYCIVAVLPYYRDRLLFN
jgi:hypothetical protein